MYLTDETDKLIKRLKKCDELNDIYFIKSFPYTKRPTVLSKITAVFSPYDMELESISVDNLAYSGLNSIAIDLFSPIRMGSPTAVDCVQRILSYAITPNVTKVSVSSVSKESDTECYRGRAVITYTLCFWGSEDE